MANPKPVPLPKSLVVKNGSKIRVWVAEDPMTCVARGAGRVLEDYDNLRKLLVGLERGSTAR